MTEGTIGAFVLAGGKSTRMGTDKSFLPFKGRTLLSRALETTHAVSDTVYIVGDPAKFSGLGQVIPDTFPDSGPLGGIHAALAANKAEFNLVLAVDLPLVTGELLRYLLREAQKSGAVATVPRVGGFLQPLCAVYKTDFAGPAEQALRAGDYKIEPLFDAVETHTVSASELREAGFSEQLFTNINTADEYRALFENPHAG